MMGEFDFISGEDFRKSLESDCRERKQCMHVGAWKAAHVLAGGVIETILIDYLVSSGYAKHKGVDPLRMDLADAISACRDQGILSATAADLSSVVRTYRNLIHPGRVVRLGESVDESSAKIADALVSIIIRDVSKRKRDVTVQGI